MNSLATALGSPPSPQAFPILTSPSHHARCAALTSASVIAAGRAGSAAATGRQVGHAVTATAANNSTRVDAGNVNRMARTPESVRYHLRKNPCKATGGSAEVAPPDDARPHGLCGMTMTSVTAAGAPFLEEHLRPVGRAAREARGDRVPGEDDGHVVLPA